MNILFAGQHILCSAFEALIQDLEPTAQSAGTCDLSKAAEYACRTSPDLVLLLDVMGEEWLAALGDIHAAVPQQKTAAVLGQANPPTVERALGLGARGLFSAESSTEELLSGIRRIQDGRRFVTGPLAEMAIDALMGKEQGDRSCPTDVLTPRERQVLLGIGEGRSSKEIARQLGLSTHTVDTHRRNMMEKLGLHNVAAVVRYAIDLARAHNSVVSSVA